MIKIFDFAEALSDTKEISEWVLGINLAWKNWLSKCDKEGFDFRGLSESSKANILKPILDDFCSILSEYELGDIEVDYIEAIVSDCESLYIHFCKKSDNSEIGLLVEESNLVWDINSAYPKKPSSFSYPDTWVVCKG